MDNRSCRAMKPLRSGSRNALPREEWDFSAVPDEELIACCYWEYARESAFIRDVKRRCVNPGWLKLTKSELWKHCGYDLERIQSIGYPSEVFLAGFFFNEAEDRKPRKPDAPPITGSFPGPWQSLEKAERKSRACIQTFKGQCSIVPVRLAHWCWAEDIARYCKKRAEEQHREFMEWERRYLRRDEKGNLSVTPGAVESPQHDPIRPGLFISNAETLLVDIAWEEFTNDEIATYFRKWVKRARPPHKPAPSGKGHKPGDWRAHLTRLGAMRLLAHFTPSQLTVGDKLPAVWESKQFRARKWRDETKWHDARREAGKVFRTLLPFLPPDEKPRSWERRPPGK